MHRIVVASLAASLSVGLSAAASAADLGPAPAPAPIYTKAPVMVPFTWTGGYVGGNVGGAWGTTNFTFLPGSAWATVPPPNAQTQLAGDGTTSFKSSGVTAGFQAGYNYQISSFVLGVEGDANYMNLRKTNNFTQTGPVGVPIITPYTLTETEKADWLYTFRGRLGYAVDRVLFYGTGGFAAAHTGTSDTLGFPTLAPASTFTGFGSRAGTQTGWVAGGGLEWAFANHWSAKGEYLHVDLQTSTTSMNAINTIFTQSYQDKTKLDIGRVGVNYHF